MAFQLKTPVGALAFRGAVEHRPDPHQVGSAARVLAGVGSGGAHVAGPDTRIKPRGDLVREPAKTESLRSDRR